jgi:NADH:ubiquinone oxidoreductase subunit K
MLLNQFLILAAAMFSLGIYGLLVRRNIVLILLSVELMLAAVNINLIAFESVLRKVGIGLAIVLMIFRNRKSANVDELDLMRW